MEIALDTPFTPDEVSLLDMHSVLNVLTVIQHEFLRLDEQIGDADDLDTLLDFIANAGQHLGNSQAASHLISNIETFILDCNQHLRDLNEKYPRLHTDGTLASVRANLEGIFLILQVRARELRERQENPEAWVPHPVKELKDNFSTLFQAIERNSHGAYRIVHNLAQHEDGNYLIHLDINGNNSGQILMPPVFQDVMRDLIANARKYTAPGGTIAAGLSLYQNGLRFVVSDTGCGIPSDEIEQVVRFGYRASNVKDRPTCGGGFGLTKAYYVTKIFKGRMWIDSPADEHNGTRIEIRIPSPTPA
ncbi:MAG: ATP-binding protein [Verrucomicrobia bacterium]|nr:ATP-binding protein [Verrucomicrobiota bacterium]MCH8528180.1 ATP-binding protein [Kiritimatiellia bacterium]